MIKENCLLLFLSFIFFIMMFINNPHNMYAFNNHSSSSSLLMANIKDVHENKLINSLPTRNFPFDESTDFDNYKNVSGIKDDNFIKRIALEMGNPNVKNFIIRYRIPFSDNFYSLVITYETGEHEIITNLVNLSKNLEILHTLIISYDEIAESAVRYRSKIEREKITVMKTDYLGEKPKKITSVFSISENGKFKKVSEKVEDIEDKKIKGDNTLKSQKRENKPQWMDKIKPKDLDIINRAEEIVLSVNNAMDKNAYGYNEIDVVNNLVKSTKLPITKEELFKFKRVRITIGDNLGIFRYNFFNCKFIEKEGKVFFQKTSGTHRISGYLYRRDDFSFVLLGGRTVNEEPLTIYESEHGQVGILYKIAQNTLIFIFPDTNYYEIYEIVK